MGIADKLGSIQRKIIYPSTKINGIPVVRVSLGNNGKIAIIGRRMPYVRKIAEDLKKLGKDNPDFRYPYLRSGFLTKSNDYVIPKSTNELIEYLRLDYKNTSFSNNEGFAVIEFKSDNASHSFFNFIEVY